MQPLSTGRVIVATRLDLAISLSAVALSFAFGSLAGACAGFYGGWSERLVSRLVDTIMAYPLFVLAMGIVAALGNTVQNVVLATARMAPHKGYRRGYRGRANPRTRFERPCPAWNGAPGGIRTPDPVVRSHMLWSTELRARGPHSSRKAPIYRTAEPAARPAGGSTEVDPQ